MTQTIPVVRPAQAQEVAQVCAPVQAAHHSYSHADGCAVFYRYITHHETAAVTVVYDEHAQCVAYWFE